MAGVFSQYFLISLLIIMLRTLDQLVKYHGDGAQDNDGSDDHIELEETQGVGERDRHGHNLVRSMARRPCGSVFWRESW